MAMFRVATFPPSHFNNLCSNISDAPTAPPTADQPHSVSSVSSLPATVPLKPSPNPLPRLGRSVS